MKGLRRNDADARTNAGNKKDKLIIDNCEQQMKAVNGIYFCS
jgi:hypothetical protein